MNRRVDDELWATLRRQYRARAAATSRTVAAAGLTDRNDEAPGR